MVAVGDGVVAGDEEGGDGVEVGDEGEDLIDLILGDVLGIDAGKEGWGDVGLGFERKRDFVEVFAEGVELLVDVFEGFGDAFPVVAGLRVYGCGAYFGEFALNFFGGFFEGFEVVFDVAAEHGEALLQEVLAHDEGGEQGAGDEEDGQGKDDEAAEQFVDVWGHGC